MADKVSQCCSSTSRKKSSLNWSQLVSDLLDLILKRLPGGDVLRSKAVCSSWKSVAQAHMSHRIIPWLMLGPKEKVESDANSDPTTLYFFNLEEQKTYKFKNAIPKELGECYCVGSSRDWLVLMDERAHPCLIPKPILQQQDQIIRLPPLRKTDALDVCEQIDGSYKVSQLKVAPAGTSDKIYRYTYESIKILREYFILKAVLCSDPSSSDNYGVLVIYGKKSQVAFFKSSSQTWSDLFSDHQSFVDIVCCKNELYALSFAHAVLVWDLENLVPIRKAIIGGVDEHLCYMTYLVESAGEVLTVDCVWEEDWNDTLGRRLIQEPCNLFRSNRRVNFEVFKLDFDVDDNFPELNSIGDQIFFIGGRHSFSLSSRNVCCEQNSVYLADAYCDRMERGHYNGGFDVCQFNFKEGITKLICQCNSWRIGKRSPYWI